MTNYRYFKVSPRGFANEVVYFRVREDQVTQVEAEYADFENDEPGRYCGWTSDKVATAPGVAVDWEDRRRL